MNNNLYYEKYIKYKSKYNDLKKTMIGGMFSSITNFSAMPVELLIDFILPSLSIKDVFSLMITNKRLYFICNDYIQSYFRRRIYMTKSLDFLYLYNIPKFRPLIKEDLDIKIDEITRLFLQLVTQRGGPVTPVSLNTNGGSKYIILFQTNNVVATINNIGTDITPSCDASISVNRRRNAVNKVECDAVPETLKRYIYNSLLPTTNTIKLTLIEYIYEPNSYDRGEYNQRNILYNLF